MTTIALLGTGTMGLPMGLNLIEHGFTVRAWNRGADKAAPLAERGATVTATASEAAAGADVVLTMLADGDVVHAVMADVLADERPPLWLQMSTVGVEHTARLVGQAATAGVEFVDAPVLGTKQPAEQGKLVVLASGRDSARASAQPVFDAVGARTIWTGAAGTSSRLKLVANAWVLAITAATAQSIALAQDLGVEPELFLDAITGGAVDVPYAHVKGKAMIAGEFPPAFPLDLAAKDARLVLAAGQGVDLALTAAVLAQLTRAQELGHGDEDMSALFRAVR